MIAVSATTSCPAWSANSTTKNSGRLPSVDCRTPVIAAPEPPPDLLGRERHDPGEPGQRERREHEREHLRERRRRTQRAGQRPVASTTTRRATPLGSRQAAPGPAQRRRHHGVARRSTPARSSTAARAARRRDSTACAPSPAGSRRSRRRDLGLLDLAEPHPARAGDEVVQLLGARMVVLGRLAPGRERRLGEALVARCRPRGSGELADRGAVER